MRVCVRVRVCVCVCVCVRVRVLFTATFSIAWCPSLSSISHLTRPSWRIAFELRLCLQVHLGVAHALRECGRCQT
jgi:hypothetical protein